MTESPHFKQAEERYQRKRIAHWDSVARKRDSWRSAGRWYHRRLQETYAYLIPPGQNVVEIGCGTADLLAALKPSHGVGIDFSPEMVKRAREKHPGLEIIKADVRSLPPIKETFDFIILSDAVNDLWDVQSVFEQIHQLCMPRTRVILNAYSRLWEFPLMLTGVEKR